MLPLRAPALARSAAGADPEAEPFTGSEPAGASVAAFFVAHAALGLAMHHVSPLASVHALLALVFGLNWALRGARPELAAVAGAYIMGSEVLWRMSGASIPWEYGKYAVALVFFATMARWRLTLAAGPLFYFALLIPSVVLSVSTLDLPSARGAISFNLSGPLALMLSASLASHLELGSRHLYRIAIAAMGPAVAIGSIALFTTMTAPEIRFTDESNWTTSGGFGPNQVSGMLGLGALFAFLYLLVGRPRSPTRVLMLVAMLALAIQSALTFSRGGLLMAGAGAALAFLYTLRDGRERVRMIALFALVFLFGRYLAVPQLDAFTGGALTERFHNLETSHRDELATSDLDIWLENPVFGVGPGRGRAMREAAAHTEFTRLLAEHGLFGLAATAILLLLCARNLRRAPPVKGRAVVLSLITWSLLFMAAYGLRVVAPSLLLGLTFANWRLDPRSRASSLPLAFRAGNRRSLP